MILEKVRIFVEKKAQFSIEAEELRQELSQNFGEEIPFLRYVVIYDVFNIEQSLLKTATEQVFSESVTDLVYESIDLANKPFIAVEYLSGQFDQRAESATECIRLIDPSSLAKVKSGKLYIFDSTDANLLDKIKKHLINKVEAKEKDLSVLSNELDINVLALEDLSAFNSYSETELASFRASHQMAMSNEDLKFVQNYFISENKAPTETEIRMLDTYWSDHCRHTTFETELNNVTFSSDDFGTTLSDALNELKADRLSLNKTSPLTLMSMATLNASLERKNGNLNDVELSDEINACSIFTDIKEDGKDEKYLIMFKNETHNHPTEIEPFGGASTCLGGAIRDPLSGRAYVYQGVRITGAGNITEKMENALPNKLPQKTISKKAAAGFSSYGNQIGLATTFVKEIFDAGFVAKRLECGGVVAVAKAENVKRLKVQAGDLIILVGGKTGRDGVGGATGSSKEHNDESLHRCSSEVQKGNPPEERKLQRLFKNPEAASLVKKCNDFGAGGVAVAIGELADGLIINLDSIPLKYLGLNATEIAISESQERMAVVVNKEDAEKFILLSHSENLIATVVAEVTDNNRLVMTKNGNVVVDLSRKFIDTSGVRQKTDVEVAPLCNENPFTTTLTKMSFKEAVSCEVKSLNNASMQGLKEMFDASIGASTVLMPYGGKFQLTEASCSVQKVPTATNSSNACTIMAHGYIPRIHKFSPYHGASYSVIESMAKVVACGGDYKKIRFTFQEYFERMENPKTWGKPLASLLGAYKTLKAFNLAAIGGKDSMSGTFLDIKVPPTLISFAVNVASASNIISNELKSKNSNLYLLKHDKNKDLLPNIGNLKDNFDYLSGLIKDKKVLSVEAVTFSRTASLVNMAMGNQIGFSANINNPLDIDVGSFIIETTELLSHKNLELIGRTNSNDYAEINGEKFTLCELLDLSRETFKDIYPIYSSSDAVINARLQSNGHTKFATPSAPLAKNSLSPTKTALDAVVKVIVPVFPGTNCEIDTLNAFKKFGAVVEAVIFKNIDENAILSSINELANKIDEADILAFAGGFSSGDEPDGSGKFIVSVIKNHTIADAIYRLIKRNGLIIGICNGFQALLKANLLTLGAFGLNISDDDKAKYISKFNLHGKLDEFVENPPTLFRNDINRHISRICHTRVANNSSPWLSGINIGELHSVPISHGEGKFVAEKSTIDALIKNNQIAFQYTDLNGVVTMDGEYNLNGSTDAIEGIVSPCGRILGKMGHSERFGENLYKNLPRFDDQSAIFKNGINFIREQKALLSSK